VLAVGATAALATVRPWGGRLPRGLVAGAVWTAAGLCLAGSCWLLLNLCQLALQGTVTDRHGRPDWLPFGERLGLTVAGALLVTTALARRRTVAGARRGDVHPLVPSGPRAASRRVRRIAYAGCVAWLPYAGLHTLGALGVPGVEPGGYQPSPEMAIALWIGIGLSIFLLLGLVSPWGQVFPRWAPPLAGRRVPRLLPIAPVWLIAPTFVLYGLGSGVFVLLIAFGALSWQGDFGLIGYGQPISFAGYGLALVIAAASYQARTRPDLAAEPPVGRENEVRGSV
jgi:hypothetical protein